MWRGWVVEAQERVFPFGGDNVAILAMWATLQFQPSGLTVLVCCVGCLPFTPSTLVCFAAPPSLQYGQREEQTVGALNSSEMLHYPLGKHNFSQNRFVDAGVELLSEEKYSPSRVAPYRSISVQVLKKRDACKNVMDLCYGWTDYIISQSLTAPCCALRASASSQLAACTTELPTSPSLSSLQLAS